MILTCSTRPRALGPAVAAWLEDVLKPSARELAVSLVPVSLADLGLPFLDEDEPPSGGNYARSHTRAWGGLVGSVDGFIVVLPEYNYGMPASFKNALDFLGREWAWKPMAFVSYGHTSAGTRSVQHAKQVITTLRLVPTGATVALRISQAFDGAALVPDPARDAAARAVLDELVHLSGALAPMRRAMSREAAPGPVPGTVALPLAPADAPDVLVLQRCCWVDEARANDTLELAALTEGLADVTGWLSTWDAWGLWRDGRLVGLVRARALAREWELGRLAVAPDLRGRGVGRWLLRHALRNAPAGCAVATLHTGAASTANIALYESEGFASTGSPRGRDVAMARPLVISYG